MDEDSAMREGSLPVSWGGLRVTKQDSQFREKNVRKYLLNYVCAARDAIYKNAFAIGGAIIDRLLKPTSSVPTLVSLFFSLVM